MNKGKFIRLYKTADYLSNNSMNQLGLESKNYMDEMEKDWKRLGNEETYLRAGFAEIGEDKKPKKDANGDYVINDDKLRELDLAIEQWQDEEIILKGSFIPVSNLPEKCLNISPALFKTINGHIINVDPEKYFEIIEKNKPKIV